MKHTPDDPRLIAAVADLLDSCDPDTLDAIAGEIDCFKHSARAAGLRSIAKRQRAAIARQRAAIAKTTGTDDDA